MRLTRKASRLLAFGVVAAVIIGAVVAINFSKSATKNSNLPPNPDATPASNVAQTNSQGDQLAEQQPSVSDEELSSGFTLQNFNRSETKDGKKLWEISGEKGLISTSGDRARIDTTKLAFFREDGSEVLLTAPKADLKIEGGLVSIANLSGGVFVEQIKRSETGQIQDYSASSDAATFDRIANLVTTNSTTTINSQMVTLTAGALKADLIKKKVLFFNGVQTVLRPNSKGFKLPGEKNVSKKNPSQPLSKKSNGKKISSTNLKSAVTTERKIVSKGTRTTSSKAPAQKKGSSSGKNISTKKSSVAKKVAISKVKAPATKKTRPNKVQNNRK